ncbi:hypothetical protein CYMTET_28707 [Cymbomonas tetramitiformis]|uniref:DUF6816 domain-containing protein n=1 Tax=Cymbomonas tetramitiformis TaxID=36881 RepID=A0AAE0FMD5_9CHLO|nr:hypothetical protein CYMTET_28707 [Cymbomonas tetramitiformis]
MPLGVAVCAAVFTRVVRRFQGEPDPQRLDTSEVMEQVFNQPDGGPPKIKESRCLTKYRWRDEAAVTNNGPVIIATQYVSDFVTAFDGEELLFKAQGKPKRIVFSKAIQFQERRVSVTMKATGGMLCTKRAGLRCFERTRAELAGPAFLWKVRGEAVAMTHGLFVDEVKILIWRIGLDPSEYSGHSFQMEGDTVAFNLGVDHVLIKLQGDEVSDAYQRHEQVSKSRRSELPMRLASQDETGRE